MSSHRDLELLVSRIEGVLAPAGAAIRSPDYILDRITGEQREVDASIRYRVGSVELLITVECRDRTRTEDVTWIEQLATKQKHIGAAHTIAVSSTGFSAPAVRAAKLHGISTRTIDEVSDTDIRDWVNTLQFEEVSTSCRLGRLHLVYDGEYPGARLEPASEQQWKDRGFDAPIFLEPATNSRLSLVELVRRATGSQGRKLRQPSGPITITMPPQSSMTFGDDPLAVLARDTPLDGSAIEKLYWIEVTEKELATETTRGLLSLRRIGFEVTMSSSRRQVAASRVVSYSDHERAIIDVAEHHFESSQGGGFIITQHRPAAGPDRSTK